MNGNKSEVIINGNNNNSTEYFEKKIADLEEEIR